MIPHLFKFLEINSLLVSLENRMLLKKKKKDSGSEENRLVRATQTVELIDQVGDLGASCVLAAVPRLATSSHPDR